MGLLLLFGTGVTSVGDCGHQKYVTPTVMVTMIAQNDIHSPSNILGSSSFVALAFGQNISFALSNVTTQTEPRLRYSRLSSLLPYRWMCCLAL